MAKETEEYRSTAQASPAQVAEPPAPSPIVAADNGERELLPLPPEEWPDISHIVTEDDTPVDNLASAKNQRLLVDPLYSSWRPPEGIETFLADANVGIFYAVKKPPVVPDVFLSLGVSVPEHWWEKRHRSYFIWEFGKPPDVVIEIVSNRKGSEDESKLTRYAHMRVLYYVIYDPMKYLEKDVLRVYELHGGIYDELPATWLPQVGLGVTRWRGTYEGKADTWLRWCNEDGVPIPTGYERAEREHERAEREHERAEQEHERAEREHERAEQERERARQLAAKLRELGIDPDGA
jgi:Uma2 family endonuclease